MTVACVQWGRWLVMAGALLGAFLPALALAQAADASSGQAAVAQAPRAMSRDLPLKRDVPGEGQGPPWIALLVLLGIGAGAAALVVRRRGAGGLLRAWQRPQGDAGIERLASQPLTPQVSVHAVRWHGEELLLACTSTQVTVLQRRSASGATEHAS